MIWMLAATLMAAAPAAISGVVRDSSGAAVPGAAVIARAATGSERHVLTGANGRFTVEPSADGELLLIVRAGGFAELIRPVSDADRVREIEIVLSPAPLLETVTVTPTRGEQMAGNVPASVHVLTGEEIHRSPAVVADDVLRQIPTFSLFRRTSSLSSHPTAQGVSLRGVGPSGVSRTLVLVDGVPFNDPFGGWVYWTRVPLESVERIEVVDGPSSSLYGNYAMGGVINIVSSRPTRRTVEFKPQFGSRDSRKADFFASDVWGNVGVAVEGSWFRTDGFPIVKASERGLIDNNATARFSNVIVKLEYSPTDRVQASFRAGRFREERGNGKILEVNDTAWTSLSGGVRIQMPDASSLQASVFADFERFHSTFLAVTPPSPTVAARSIVRLTTDQHVPTNAAGGMLQWSRALGRSQYLSAGADWRWVDGDSQEDAFNAAPGAVTPPVQPGVLALKRVSGGTQRSVGGFVQDILAPLPRLTLTISARADHWRNYDAHNLETNVPSGTPTANNRLLPVASKTMVSPRLAALYHVTDRINLWGGVGTGFRAPTLNELYRQFRVGTVLTLANELLGPERLVGAEAGLTVTPARHITIRSTWFDNRVENPVSNVTLSAVGAGVTQQRQNLGRTRIRGLQNDVEVRVGSSWRISGAYLFNRATVVAFAANPGLVDKFLPQVPRHRGSVRVAYANARYVTAALGVQFIGTQFDDDLNARAVPGRSQAGLPGYAVADVTLSRALHRNLDMFFGVQNLFDREYIVGTLPTTIGSPRLINGGVRIRFAGRS
ncbi:MAG: TonB-dependent receptor [Acidobacteria bacterium]|nr:TonB-dependent receptor [Acidobacteriota bacterium]